MSDDISTERRNGMLYLTICGARYNVRPGHLPDSLRIILCEADGMRSEEMQVNPVMANVVVVAPSDRK